MNNPKNIPENSEKIIKDICMKHFSKILEELEPSIDTDKITLTISVECDNFKAEIHG